MTAQVAEILLVTLYGLLFSWAGYRLLLAWGRVVLVPLVTKWAESDRVKDRAPGSSDQRSIDQANGSTGEANP